MKSEITLHDNKGQLFELTSARFLAAMAVLLGHFQPFLAMSKWFSWITGGYGVSFFFVLSGFILCYRYWDEFAAGVKASAYWKYLLARIARVYPLYLLALILISALYIAVNLYKPGAIKFPDNPVKSWLINALALQTFSDSIDTQQFWNAPGWSISTEFGFYFVCPFIFAIMAKFLSTRRSLVFSAALILTYGLAIQSAALIMVFKYNWNLDFWLNYIASRNIFWRITEFLCGIMAARFLYGGHLLWLKDTLFRNLLLIGCLTVVAFLNYLNVAEFPLSPAYFYGLRQLRLDLAYMIPFAGIVIALASGPTFVSPWLRQSAWVFLGEISYGIYILHWISWTCVSFAVAYGVAVSPLMAILVIIITILFSAASYLWFEKPVRTLIRRTAIKNS